MKIKKQTSYVLDYVLDLMEEVTLISLHLHPDSDSIVINGKASQQFFSDNPCRSKIYNDFIAYDLIIENINVSIVEKRNFNYDGSY